MDGERLSQSPSDGVQETITYAQIFREQFPYYLYLGMTYEQYWEMDCELVKAYRKAYELKQEYDNSQAWLQGLYNYQAVNALRPGFVFYGKKAPKPEKYVEQPFAFTEEARARRKAEETRKMAEQFKIAFHKRNQNLEKPAPDGPPEEGLKNG